jgi:hypothetical protein
MLNDREKWHAQLKRLDDTFTDHDCSTEGFEGVRAQDILPLILARFHPYKFFGTGGFIDPFVDRGYGRAYDASKPEDVEWIKFISRLNDIMLDAGSVKPTVMYAYFTKTLEGRLKSIIAIAEPRPLCAPKNLTVRNTIPNQRSDPLEWREHELLWQSHVHLISRSRPPGRKGAHMRQPAPGNPLFGVLRVHPGPHALRVASGH